MSRISNENAGLIAKAIISKKIKEIEDKRTDFSVILTDSYEKIIPESVKKEYEANPRFFKKSSDVYLRGSGFSGDYFRMTKSLPHTNNYTDFDIGDADKEILFKIHREIQKLESKANELKIEIKTTLLSLGTYKRIADNFPEAVPFLPKSNTMAIVPNLDKVRKQVASIL